MFDEESPKKNKNINGVQHDQQKFHQLCIPLLFYLKDIEGKSKSNSIPNIKESCICFYYNLMDLVKKYNGKFDERQNCYNILKRKRRNANLIELPKVCNVHLQDLYIDEENLYGIFYFMNILYGIINNLSRNQHLCKQYSQECEGNIKRLRSCDFSANKSLQDVIGNIENRYHEECPNHVYTNYGSLLKHGVKGLRSMLKKKSKRHNDLMNSFEMIYKNSVDKKYQIAYSSEYY
ncbi:variable surface protein [Plasmodium gonderi]|uniref:Variable surface protein n=1 Tax=Plasmodium gonderi TaxID=77519 RepID=A0A1Y1JRY8_PLAGO|nr:variable surface protein [Plasmodium gonderi]GAW84235.1 variable surface protein [Plasmodium gonderi]